MPTLSIRTSRCARSSTEFAAGRGDSNESIRSAGAVVSGVLYGHGQRPDGGAGVGAAHVGARSDHSVQLIDPYEIACLRGGANEVLRLATTRLIDRGLLTVEGANLKVANQSMAQLVRTRVERAILEHFWTENTVTSLFARTSLRREGESFETLLQHRGLISDREARMPQLLTCVGAIGVLWVTAVTKIEIAVERGYPYTFLVMLAIPVQHRGALARAGAQDHSGNGFSERHAQKAADYLVKQAVTTQEVAA